MKGVVVTGKSLAEKIEEEIFKIKEKKAIKDDGKGKKSDNVESRELEAEQRLNFLKRLGSKKSDKKPPKTKSKEEDILAKAISFIQTIVKYLDKIEDKDSFIANLYGLPRNAQQQSAYSFAPQQGADYSKIWGHLGKDNVVRMYDGAAFDASSAGTTTQEMVPYQKLEGAVKHFKYHTAGGIHMIMLDAFYGNVPAAGMDSKEWDKMKIYMMADRGVMFKLLTHVGI